MDTMEYQLKNRKARKEMPKKERILCVQNICWFFDSYQCEEKAEPYQSITPSPTSKTRTPVPTVTEILLARCDIAPVMTVSRNKGEPYVPYMTCWFVFRDI